MAIAYVQSKSVDYTANNANAFPVQFSSNCTAGNTFIVAIVCSASCIINSVIDDSFNNYQQCAPPDSKSSGIAVNLTSFNNSGSLVVNTEQVQIAIFYVPKAAVVNSKVTVTANITYASNAFIWVAAHEYSGLGQWSSLDGMAWNTYSTANIASAASNPVQTLAPNELIFAVFYTQSSLPWLAGSGFTGREFASNISNVVPAAVMTEDDVVNMMALVNATAITPALNEFVVGSMATFADQESIDRVLIALGGDALIR